MTVQNLSLPSLFPAHLTRLARRVGPALATLGAATLAACSQGSAQGGHGFPPAPVTIEAAKTSTVPLRFEYVGQTAGSKDAEVRARVTGILEKRVYQEGGAVKSGQTLFIIDPKPYAAQLQQADAQVAQANAQLAQAQRNHERLKTLISDNAVSRREFDDAVSAQELAQANLKAAIARQTEAKLNLSYTQVTAPVSGFAARAQKSEGSLVAPGQESLLTTVSQIDPLHVNFSIAENEQLRLNKLLAEGKLQLPDAKKGNYGYEVSVRLADGTIYPRKGRLVFVDSRINSGTGGFDAQAELPNPEAAIKPGQFVRAILEGGQRPDTITVPQRAVMESPQGKFVYIAGKDKDGKDVAFPRPITVSDWIEIGGTNQWIVESGLKPGDPVIVEGMAKIFPNPNGSPIMVGAPPGAEAGKGAPAGGAPKSDAKKAEGKK
jgi:membrane fusion protein (multidrug efflux system)